MAFYLIIFLLFASNAYSDDLVNVGGIFNKSGYNTVQDEGTNLKQRKITNFVGSGISCVDDPSGNRTVCTVGVVSNNFFLLEDGTFILLEDSGKIILE